MCKIISTRDIGHALADASATMLVSIGEDDWRPVDWLAIETDAAAVEQLLDELEMN